MSIAQPTSTTTGMRNTAICGGSTKAVPLVGRPFKSAAVAAAAGSPLGSRRHARQCAHLHMICTMYSLHSTQHAQHTAPGLSCQGPLRSTGPSCSSPPQTPPACVHDGRSASMGGLHTSIAQPPTPARPNARPLFTDSQAPRSSQAPCPALPCPVTYRDVLRCIACNGQHNQTQEGLVDAAGLADRLNCTGQVLCIMGGSVDVQQCATSAEHDAARGEAAVHRRQHSKKERHSTAPRSMTGAQCSAAHLSTRQRWL